MAPAAAAAPNEILFSNILCFGAKHYEITVIRAYRDQSVINNSRIVGALTHKGDDYVALARPVDVCIPPEVFRYELGFSNELSFNTAHYQVTLNASHMHLVTAYGVLLTDDGSQIAGLIRIDNLVYVALTTPRRDDMQLENPPFESVLFNMRVHVDGIDYQLRAVIPTDEMVVKINQHLADAHADAGFQLQYIDL